MSDSQFLAKRLWVAFGTPKEAEPWSLERLEQLLDEFRSEFGEPPDLPGPIGRNLRRTVFVPYDATTADINAIGHQVGDRIVGMRVERCRYLPPGTALMFDERGQPWQVKFREPYEEDPAA